MQQFAPCPQGSLLLDSVEIKINNSTKTLDEEEMTAYLRQLPNHKMLWSTKFRLGIYNMSGSDTTKWWNRWIRKLGEPCGHLRLHLDPSGKRPAAESNEQQGVSRSIRHYRHHHQRQDSKMKVKYSLNPGLPHVINSISYSFPDTLLRNLIMRDSAKFIVRKGDNLDRSLLESQREWITRLMRDHGYYSFAKEYITFSADTTEGSRLVDLTMTMNPVFSRQSDLRLPHEKFTIGRVFS